jgi:hypothetical protein
MQLCNLGFVLDVIMPRSYLEMPVGFCPPNYKEKPNIHQWMEKEQLLLDKVIHWNPIGSKSGFRNWLIERKPLLVASVWILFLITSGFSYFVSVGLMISLVGLFAVILMALDIELAPHKAERALSEDQMLDLHKLIRLCPPSYLSPLAKQINTMEMGQADLRQVHSFSSDHLRWRMEGEHLIEKFGHTMGFDEKKAYRLKLDGYTQYFNAISNVSLSLFMARLFDETESFEQKKTLTQSTPEVLTVHSPNRL